MLWAALTAASLYRGPWNSIIQSPKSAGYSRTCREQQLPLLLNTQSVKWPKTLKKQQKWESTKKPASGGWGDCIQHSGVGTDLSRKKYIPTGLQQHGNNNTPIFQFQQQHWKTLSLPKLIHVSMWGGEKVILTHLVPASCFSQLLWISKFKCYNWSWVKNRISVIWETDILACFYTESEQKKKNLKFLMKGQSKKIQFWTHPYWYI